MFKKQSIKSRMGIFFLISLLFSAIPGSLRAGNNFDVAMDAAGKALLAASTMASMWIMWKQIKMFLPKNPELAQPEAIKETLQDVRGEIPYAIKDLIKFIRESSAFDRVNARPPKGILFTGKPGVGKTLLARAIAKESGSCFLYSNAAELQSKWVGGSAENVKRVFDVARKQSQRCQKPVIIFIDEIDAMGDRQSGLAATDGSMINQMLSCMDGFNQDGNIVVIAATNYPERIDGALKRSGRFDFIVEISEPNREAREDILRYYAYKHPLDMRIDDEFFSGLARLTEGFVGADLANLVNQAATMAGSRGAPALMREDFKQPYAAIARKKDVEVAQHRTAAVSGNPFDKKGYFGETDGYVVVKPRARSIDNARDARGLQAFVFDSGYTLGANAATAAEQPSWVALRKERVASTLGVPSVRSEIRGTYGQVPQVTSRETVSWWRSLINPALYIGGGIALGYIMDMAEDRDYAYAIYRAQQGYEKLSPLWLGGHRWKVIGGLMGTGAAVLRARGTL